MGLGMARPSFQRGTTDPEQDDQIDVDRNQPVVQQAETGEEAYLRRLQMSQNMTRGPVAAAPSFIQSKAKSPPPVEVPPAVPPFVLTEEPEMDEEMELYPNGPPEESVPPASASFVPLTQDAIDERKRAAAAIAARLAALIKTQPVPSAPPAETSQPQA